MKIILDTNFAVIPFQFKVDIYSKLSELIEEDYELLFLNLCKSELEKLKYGKAGLELMKQKGVKFVKAKLFGGIDNSILEFAKENKCAIATQDKELKKKALKKGLKIITMRQRKHLMLI